VRRARATRRDIGDRHARPGRDDTPPERIVAFELRSVAAALGVVVGASPSWASSATLTPMTERICATALSPIAGAVSVVLAEIHPTDRRSRGR
jgi:hypothetical protein